MPMIEIDFSRAATKKERAVLEGRLRRLERPGQAELVNRVGDLLPGNRGIEVLCVRIGFSFQANPPRSDASDRRALPRSERPPATRLITSRGGALRLMLTMIAIAQRSRRRGERAALSGLVHSLVGDSQQFGWSDLLVSDAEDTNSGRNFLRARDKRARSVRASLESLQDAGLVSLAAHGAQGRFDGFVLLNEAGPDKAGENEEYRVPKAAEHTFLLPMKLVTNGWIHVLTDVELALLLMVAAHPKVIASSPQMGWMEEGLAVVPPDVRLLHYGLHRDGYSAARKTLEWFGLLQVEEVGRYSDGRAENSELRTHRMALRLEGFDALAIATVTDVLKEQIRRSVS